MNNKKIFKSFAIILLVLMMGVTIFSSCNKKNEVKISDMKIEELEEIVSLCKYKGVEFTLTDESKESAIISYLEKNSEVSEYPEGVISYYTNQLKTQYGYYADDVGMTYDELIYALDMDIDAEAKRLAKQDLILELIRKKENITLSAEEKSEFLDRYVEKYAENYRYSEEYVREELLEIVYDSMLYDKTIEFLIINNSFSENK